MRGRAPIVVAVASVAAVSTCVAVAALAPGGKTTTRQDPTSLRALS
jgi:hypothetical protein